jgi:hypothetical protein
MALSTLAEPAFGTDLNLCIDANGTSPSTIASVRDINFTLSAQIEDSTTHDTASPYRTKVATLLNVGPIEAMVNWVPTDATHNGTTGILAVWQARAERTYQLVETDSGTTTYEWNAIVASIKMGRPVAGLRSGSVTWEGTGVPDFDV